MKLIEGIKYLKTIEETEEFLRKELPDTEIDLADVYLKGKLNAQSEIKIFNAEDIPNMLEIEIEGIKYVNLFPLNMLQEMVMEYWNNSNRKLSDEEIVFKLLEYRWKFHSN